MTNIFLISKPKKFFWFYKLFKMQPFIVDTMFSNQINPILPKGFTKYKLIGRLENNDK